MTSRDRRSLLQRELTDVSDAVRNAPPPVVPELASPYSLRLVDPDSNDPDTIAEWMTRPHLVETWEQPWSARKWRADSVARLAGSYSRPCILSFDFASIGRPEDGVKEVGYVEMYRPAKDECGKLYDAAPSDMGFHIATADLDLIDRGLISTWTKQLSAEIFAADADCRRIVLDPDYRNTRMHRALDKIGWTALGVVDARADRRISLYALPRTPADLPVLR